MLLIAENIPATSETVPLIVIYLTCVMSLTSISIILTVFVSRFHHPRSYTPAISRRMYRFMTNYIASYVGMSETVKQYEEQTKRKTKANISNVDFINSVKRNPLRNFGEIAPLNLANESQSNNVCGSFPVFSHTKKAREEYILKNVKRINTGVTCLRRIREKSAVNFNNIIETEWKLIGLIVDRLFFWLIGLCCFVSSMITLVILPVLKHEDLI
jgi:hypothetical protein